MRKRRGLSAKGWLLAVVLSITVTIGFVAATSDRRNFELVKNLDIFYTLFSELNSY